MKNVYQKYASTVNFFIVLALLITTWIKVHWSVTILLGYMAFTLSVFAWALKRIDSKIKLLSAKSEKENKINQKHLNMLEEIDNIKNICIECQEHPTGVRLGAIHNKTADNCLLKINLKPIKHD